MDCFASLAMTMCVSHADTRRKSSFTNSVDPIFTTFIQRAFTKDFAVKAEPCAIACLCRARNAD
jgi:hypothetical protein